MVEELVKRLRSIYPKRDGGQGWAVVPRLLERALANGADVERIELGVANYARHCQKKGIVGSEFVQQARTFFGPGQWWDEWADMDVRTPAEIALDGQWQRLEARAKALGFKEVDRSRGLATVEYAIKAEEDKRRLRVVS